jgi:hypothetical protein
MTSHITPIAIAIGLRYGLVAPSPTAGISWPIYVLAGGSVSHIGRL